MCSLVRTGKKLKCSIGLGPENGFRLRLVNGHLCWVVQQSQVKDLLVLVDKMDFDALLHVICTHRIPCQSKFNQGVSLSQYLLREALDEISWTLLVA